MVNDSVTVIVPHIPTRPNALAKAIKSASTQTVKPTDIIIAIDTQHEGSAATRNRALMGAITEWVAFLDDDDAWFPNHLETVLTHAHKVNADVVYPGCTVVNPELGGIIPLNEEWGRFGLEFDGELLREKSYIPVTSLVRTSLAQKALFGPPAGMNTYHDDWGFYIRLLDLGAKFSHVPEITWVWNHHGKNTSGQSDKW